MNRTRLHSQITWITAQPGDGVARFDHLNSVPRNRPKPPAHPTSGAHQCPPLPTHWWDPRRPGWRQIVTDPAGQELRPGPVGSVTHPEAA